MLSTLFAIGVIAGMVWLNLADSDSADPSIGIAAIKASETQSSDHFSTSLTNQPSDEDTEFAYASLQTGDRYLIAGNHEAALAHYHEIASSSTANESSLLLREAFCYELTARNQQAGKKYYRSIARSSNHNHLLLATAGYARCLTNDGKRADAVELVADLMLKLNDFDNVPAESRAWLSFLYARLSTLTALNVDTEETGHVSDAQDLTAPYEVVFDYALIAPELFLEVLDKPCDKIDALDRNPNETSISVLQRPAETADLISLSVSATLQPVTSLAALMAEKAELNLTVSSAAAEALRNRSKTIRLNGASLSLILDSLLVPLDLIWIQSGSDIQVLSMQEVAASEQGLSAIQSYRFEAADRSLRSFELEFQSSERRLEALLSRGNLNVIRKQYDVAENRYQELELAAPKGEILASLFFNQAKLQLLLKNNPEARRLLYLAIDQTVDANVESSSYCLLSSSLLSTSDMDATVTAARRAIATAVDSRQIRWATLNLARSYLLANNPFAANDALFRLRDAFSQSVAKQATPIASRQRVVASLLGAYARFRGVSDQRQIQAERNRLLTSIAMLDDAAFESFADCYVAARAYRELGFADKAIDKMLLSLARPDIGQWQRQLMFELGQLQQSTGRKDEAIKTFELLTDTNDQWRTLALERLIKLYIDNGKIDQSIAQCQQLWKAGLDDEQKRTTLKVLGEAYQQQGEYHTAALCFAGILPDSP